MSKKKILSQFPEWMKNSGYGNGSGDGYGNGYGNGDGYGNGYGNGNGDGYNPSGKVMVMK